MLGGLAEAMTVLGQADVVDAVLAGALGVLLHAGRRELRRAERDAVRREVEVIVDQQGNYERMALQPDRRALTSTTSAGTRPPNTSTSARVPRPACACGRVRERDAAPHATALDTSRCGSIRPPAPGAPT